MFLSRRAALRFLSASSNLQAVKPRSLATFSTPPVQRLRPTFSSNLQKRWATDDAAAAKEEEVPVSQLQPTAQEEVENAISEDNAGAHIEEAARISEDEGATKTGLDSGDAIDSATTNAASELAYNTATGRSRETNPERPTRPPAEPKSTLYIGNLFFDVTENDLVKELARFGTIKRARLIRDARGLSKGFGYVEFETVDMAQKAIDALNQQLFEGRRLNVQFAALEFRPGFQDRSMPERPTNPPTKTLFIGNMAFEMTDRDLNNLFKGIRNVVDVRVAIDRRTGQPRGFAHADFVDVKSAMEAMKVLKDKESYGRKLRVDFSYGPSTAPRNQPENREP